MAKVRQKSIEKRKSLPEDMGGLRTGVKIPGS